MFIREALFVNPLVTLVTTRGGGDYYGTTAETEAIIGNHCRGVVRVVKNVGHVRCRPGPAPGLAVVVRRHRRRQDDGGERRQNRVGIDHRGTRRWREGGREGGRRR